MKFLSVIVLVICIYVPVTYSYNVGQTSWKPNETQNKYVNSNIQNTYQPNVQILQPTKDAVNIPISSPTANSNDINRNRQPPIQYVDQKVPTYSYQAPQNVPVTQNTQQINVQNNGNGLTSPLPAQPYQYSPPNLNLKKIYEASKPTKQYTIVHLNGTVEHTNDLQAIAARFPKFVMLKASDVLANKYLPVQGIELPSGQNAQYPTQNPAATAQQPIPNSQGASLSNTSPSYQSISNVKSQQPAVGTTPVPISATPSFQQPISLTKQQIQTNPTNTYLDGSNSQSTIQSSNGPALPTIPNTVPSQTVPPIPNYNWRTPPKNNIPPLNQQNGNPPNIYYQNPNNQVANQPVTEDLHKNAVASNPSAFNQPVSQQNTPNISSSAPYGSTSISQGNYNNPLSTNTLHENAVAANPLPVYPETPVPNVAIKTAVFNQPFTIGAAAAQPVIVPVQQPIALPNNSQNIILQPKIIKDKQEAITAINSNLSIPYIDPQNRSSSINLPISTNPIPASYPNVADYQNLPILLPEVQPQNTLQKKVPPTTIQELRPGEVTPDKNTSYQVTPSYNIFPTENKTAEPVTKITTSEGSAVLEPSNKNNLDPITPNKVLNIAVANTQPIDKANVTRNNVDQKERQPTAKPDNTNSTTPSVSVEPSTLSPSDKQWSLLSLNDDGIWNLIRNNSQNIYFFFMPPRPKVTKENKTIIFANGTTVEEVTETVVDIAADGEPKMTITTTKSYS